MITCSPSPCAVTGLIAPTNGAFGTDCPNSGTWPSGVSCDQMCNSGYTASGAQPTCTRGILNGGTITCAPNACTVTSLTAPTNGAFGNVCPNTGTWASGVTCDQTCNNGYTLSGAQPTCSTGTLNAGSIACSPSPCTVTGLTAPANGAFGTVCPNSGTWASGVSCDQTCNSGYTLSGAQPTCIRGTLTSGTIGCAPNSCVVTGLTAPQNGTLKFNSGCEDGTTITSGSSSCDLMCNQGYSLFGSQPGCLAGAFSTGSVYCVEDCTVTGLTSPTN